MLWSSGDELDDEDVFTYLFIYSAVYEDKCCNCPTLMYYCTLMTVSVKLSRFLCIKSVVIYYILFRCDCEILCCVLFFLLSFLLLPPSSFFLTIGFSGIRLFDMLDSERIYVDFRRSKIPGCYSWYRSDG